MDAEGNAWIVGASNSTNFPVQNAYQSNRAGAFDAFVAEITPQGALAYSSYLGASTSISDGAPYGVSRGYAIAIDSTGDAWIAGDTNATDLPGTDSAFQKTNGGTYDAFIAEITPAGALAWASYLGGALNERPGGIAMGKSNDAWIVGYTNSTDFPKTSDALQSDIAGGMDVFVAQITLDGTLSWASYLGGTSHDYATGVAVDSTGDAWVAGYTSSTDFPTQNPFQAHNAGGPYDALVFEISPVHALDFSTYIGGSTYLVTGAVDYGQAIAVDSTGNVLVSGTTYCTDFPTLNGSQSALAGKSDTFVIDITPQGVLAWSTLMGGDDYDSAVAIAVDASGGVWTAGYTQSTNFPVLGGFQTSRSSASDAFIAEINPVSSGPLPVSITTASLPADTVGIAYNQSLSATGGTLPYTWSLESGSLPAGIALGPSTGAITGTPSATATAGFVVKVTDSLSATCTQSLSIVINAAPVITTASLSGGTVGAAYSQTLAATGGTTPNAWWISPGSLPTGLSLNTSTGAITGTPTTSGTSGFTARVTDNVGATAAKALSITVTLPLSITTSGLPADTVGIAYSRTLTAAGGTGPYTWSKQSGNLPAGLSLVAATGAITGTPTASGTASFTAKVTDHVGATATKALSIVVNAAISITTTTLPGDTVNIAYSRTLAATGGTGALTWSRLAGSLPAGLNLAASTGVISGTPTATGTSSFTAKATDTVGATGTKALSIVVHVAASITTSSLPAGTAGAAYNRALKAAGGTSPLTWSVSGGALPAGLSIVGSTGAITGTPSTNGTTAFTAMVTDNVGVTASRALSIVINPALVITTTSLPADTIKVAYSQTLAFTGGTPPRTWTVSSGSLPAGLYLNATTGSITGTPTVLGTAHFTAKATDKAGATATQALVIVVNAAPSITTTLPGDTVNIAYSQTLAATGGTAPLAWSIASGNLPAGLSLVASTGVVSGTPTATGTSNFTAKVTDSKNVTGTKALSIVVHVTPSITTSSLRAGTAGAAYNRALKSAGGTSPRTWSASGGALPAGLSIVGATGAVTGTPSADGTANFTVMLTDNVGVTATKALSLTINPALVITTTSLPADTMNVAYNRSLALTGGTAPYTWVVATGSLPAGLSLVAATGSITGTPSASGTRSFTAKVSDHAGATATKALAMVINAAPAITTTALPNGHVSVSYSQTLAEHGGTAPLTWSVKAGNLPSGLAIAPSTGTITGVPLAAGTSRFTVQLTDTYGVTAAKALSIVVK